jgi:RNA polymerase sigma-B factor
MPKTLAALVPMIRRGRNVEAFHSSQAFRADARQVYQALDKLSAFQTKLIYLLFFKDLTQHEAAQELGLNQQKVSRGSIKALGKLRTVLDKRITL